VSKEIKSVLIIGIIITVLAVFIAGCGGDSGGGGGDITPTPTTSGWISQDSGTTNRLNDVCFMNTNDGLMVGDNGTILKTGDGGTSWLYLNSGVSSNLKGIHFADSNSGTAVGDSGVILTTSDAGETWNERNPEIPRQISPDLNGVFMVGSSIWAVGESGSILYSPDLGVTWTSQISGVTANLNAVWFIDSTTGWIVGEGGTILHSTDAGNTWLQQSSGVNGTLYGVCFVNSFTGWACGTGGVLLNTADSGATWTSQTSPTKQDLNDIYFVDSTKGWAVGARGTIIHTTTGKGNWGSQNSGVSSDLTGVFFTDGSHGHASGSGSTILGTSNGGEPTPTPTTSPTSSPTVSPSPTPTSSPTVSPTSSPTVSPSPTPTSTTTPGPGPGPGPGEKKWRGSTEIDNGTDNAGGEQQVACSADGNAMAVFMQNDGARDVVYARIWNGTAWENIEVIDDPLEGDSSMPDVAYDPQGNAMCVFSQDSGGRFKLFARKYDNATSTWGNIEAIDDPAQGDSFMPDIQFAPDGTALCVFNQEVGGTCRVYANYYDGTNWGVAGIIDTGADQEVVNQKIAVNENKNGVCVFIQNNGTRDRVYARIWDGNAKAWVADCNAIDLNTADIGDAQGFLGISFASNNDAIAVFDQEQLGVPGVGDTFRVFANRLHGGAWQGAVTIDGDPTASAKPAVAITNDGGSALAVFIKHDESVDHDRIFANRWNGTSWGTPIAIDDPNENFSNNPDIAMDNQGNAFCIFTQWTNEFAFRTYVNGWNGNNWGATTRAIDSDTPGAAFSPPHVAFDGNGNAVAVFNEFPDFITPRVYANVYK